MNKPRRYYAPDEQPALLTLVSRARQPHKRRNPSQSRGLLLASLARIIAKREAEPKQSKGVQ